MRILKALVMLTSTPFSSKKDIILLPPKKDIDAYFTFKVHRGTMITQARCHFPWAIA